MTVAIVQLAVQQLVVPCSSVHLDGGCRGSLLRPSSIKLQDYNGGRQGVHQALPI
jgi:hypothetical protein